MIAIAALLASACQPPDKAAPRWRATPASTAALTFVGWGADVDGESRLPVPLRDVGAVAAGGDHSLALKRDGTVQGWGSNVYGESLPPAGLSGVTALSAGREYSLALKADGTIVGWGTATSGCRCLRPAATTRRSPPDPDTRWR